MRLSADFYRRKVHQCQDELSRRGLAGLLLLDYRSIWYLTGFFHFPTERLVAVFIPVEGEPTLFIPKLEEDQVRENWIENVRQYFEYPGVKQPLQYVTEYIRESGLATASIGYEGSAPAAVLHRLGDALPRVAWQEAGEIIASMRLVKEPEEIELIRKAAEYSDFMVAEGVRIVRETGGDVSEVELLRAVVDRTTDRMLKELDEIIYVGGIADGLICSGERSAFPHGLPSTRRLKPGDNLILSFGCVVGGYNAESERTFFLGAPSSRQREIYQILREAQQEGTAALKSGVRACDANRYCLALIEKAGLGEYIKHRQGHGIGISNHEPPWLEDGDRTILRPGMVVSSEPGIYVSGQGGFRISDTVLISESGPECLTKFPRGLEDIIIDL